MRRDSPVPLCSVASDANMAQRPSNGAARSNLPLDVLFGAGGMGSGAPERTLS